MKIILASQNPVKIRSAEVGFRSMFPGQDLEVQGCSVPSGVSDQPMSAEETLQGARNRALNAQSDFPKADYWVGIEGGLSRHQDKLEAFAWVVVLSEDLEGEARTASFALPPEVARLVESGMELGDADDIVFKADNSKQKSGAVGLLTNNVMTRETLYSPAVILALIPFKRRDLYSKDD